MRRETQGLLILLIGLTAIRLITTGSYLWYLKAGMKVPLLLAGLILVGLGGATMFRGLAAAYKAEPDDRHDGHMEHGHPHGPTKAAWLLGLPVLVLIVVGPPPLGADAAASGGTRVPTAPASVSTTAEATFPPLAEPVDGAVNITLSGFTVRAVYDETGTMTGVPLRLTGFVTNDPEVADGFRLTRFSLSCCAADAYPIAVEVHGLDLPAPPIDTWVEVVGTWIEPPAEAVGADRIAAVHADSVLAIEQPAFPYE